MELSRVYNCLYPWRRDQHEQENSRIDRILTSGGMHPVNFSARQHSNPICHYCFGAIGYLDIYGD